MGRTESVATGVAVVSALSWHIIKKLRRRGPINRGPGRGHPQQGGCSRLHGAFGSAVVDDADVFFEATTADNVTHMEQPAAAPLGDKKGLLSMQSLTLEIDAALSGDEDSEQGSPRAAPLPSLASAFEAADEPDAELDLALMATEGGMNMGFEDYEDMRLFLIALLCARKQLRTLAINAGMVFAGLLVLLLVVLLVMPRQQLRLELPCVAAL